MRYQIAGYMVFVLHWQSVKKKDTKVSYTCNNDLLSVHAKFCTEVKYIAN